MLAEDEEKYILDNAYVPEHTVGLMTSLSGGEGFLVDDYFFCCRDDWIILIGYPLQQAFTLDGFEAVLEKIKQDFKPARISLIAPQISNRLRSICRQTDSDYYYTLVTAPPVLGDAVRRNLKKAAQMVSVERASRMGEAHRELMDEFVTIAKPPDRIKDLFYKMPRYVEAAPTAWVLNAWYTSDVLAAFYVVDLAAGQFANYIIGCYSKQNYVRGASDLLASELLAMKNESAKDYIHMGLGINDGIRRFKTKWGAQPTRPYEMCELEFKRPLLKTFFKSILRA